MEMILITTGFAVTLAAVFTLERVLTEKLKMERFIMSCFLAVIYLQIIIDTNFAKMLL